MISAIFRPDQVFFKNFGSLHRRILSFVSFFFVQNEESKTLLANIGIRNVTISGDTRFDRVFENALAPKAIELIAKFSGTAATLIAGSTWAEDEQLLKQLISEHSDWKFIIAPHEIHEKHIHDINQLFPLAVRYSELNDASINSRILIIDNIGLLSSVYQYGDIAYIGGGFGAGIHNTLEAAAFGLPVIFGPNYHKFQEARDLIELKAAISIKNQQELQEAFRLFSTDNKAGLRAKDYVINKKGSTEQIMQHISKYISL